MLKVAVLITCHNRKDNTLRCLSKLFSQERINDFFILQVYLVDDGSTDGTKFAVQEAFPNVIILDGNGDLYWNRGMHTAWKAAALDKYDYYLWLNDDTEIYSNTLEYMLFAAISKYGRSIICGSLESSLNKGKLTYGGGKHTGKEYISNYPNGKLCISDVINGNCVLVPHDVFLLVGNLDWKYIHAIGDNDYSLRAKKLNILTYSTGSFVGTCELHDSLPKWCQSEVNIIERIKNLYSPLAYSHPYYQFIYEYKHFGVLSAIKHFLSIHLRVFIPSLWK